MLLARKSTPALHDLCFVTRGLGVLGELVGLLGLAATARVAKKTRETVVSDRDIAGKVSKR